jgi:curved DNA-binding protein CbpA
MVGEEAGPEGASLNPYEVLGLPPDANDDQIKATKRKLSREHHPDHGGDPAKMAEVNMALAVVTDPVRRQRYDETGDTDNKSVEDEARSNFRAMVKDAVEKNQNIVKLVRKLVAGAKQQVTDARREGRAQLAKYESRRAKVRSKDTTNMALQVIDGLISDTKAGLSKVDRFEEVNNLVGGLLKLYEDGEGEELMPTGSFTIQTFT